jgi:hypothetical protein
MARIDKTEPHVGSFRAPLGFAPVAADVGKIYAVDISGTGTVIKSVDGTDCRGVICLSSLIPQGKPVDVMTSGEIVDILAAADGVTGFGAGVLVKAGAAGVVSNVAAGKAIGWFVQSWRLIVRLQAVAE